jgi:hypothetical protein
MLVFAKNISAKNECRAAAAANTRHLIGVGAHSVLSSLLTAAFGAFLPLIGRSANAQKCPLSVIPSFASGGRGDQKAAARTRLLHMLTTG